METHLEDGLTPHEHAPDVSDVSDVPSTTERPSRPTVVVQCGEPYTTPEPALTVSQESWDLAASVANDLVERMMIGIIPNDSMDGIMSQMEMIDPDVVTGDVDGGEDDEFLIRDDSLEDEIRNTLVEWGDGLMDDGWELHINGDDCWETPRTAASPPPPVSPEPGQMMMMWTQRLPEKG